MPAIFRTLLIVAATAAPGLAQCLSQRLEPPVPAVAVRFGSVLTIDDGRLVIGDWHEEGLGKGAGAAHAYRFDAASGAWVFTQTVRSVDTGYGYNFGQSVSLDGDRLIVGAPYSDLAGIDTGAAYIFEAEGDRWIETGQLVPPEPVWRNEFGRSVALVKDVALASDLSDSVWLYQQTPAGWEVREKLRPPDDPPVNSYFGAGLTIDDDWVFIAAPFDASVATQGGSVYVYRRRPGAQLEFTQKLIPPDAETGPRFGAVSQEGATLAVGGYTSDRLKPDQGAVYMYALEGGRWELRQELTHADPSGDDYFGNGVALSGDTLVVGANRQRTPWGSGAAYVFRRATDGTICAAPPDALPRFDGLAGGLGARRQCRTN